MATIRKIRKKYQAEVRRKGFYSSKTFDTKINAQAWAIETEQFLDSNSIVKGKTLYEALERYIKEVLRGRKAERSDTIRANKFKRSILADITLLNLTTEDINRWINEQTTSASSINRDLNLLSGVLSSAVKWKWLKNNPCQGCSRPKKPPSRDRRISENEKKRILEALFFDADIFLTPRKQTAYGFLLALETAMRQGEIWGLRWEDINFKQKFLTLHDTKNGSKRYVPLSTGAIEILKNLDQKKEGKIFKIAQESAGVYFRKAVKIAGITNLKFHDTRHEALTQLARKLDLLDLARMVGHKDPRSLMIYYNPTPTEIADRLG